MGMKKKMWKILSYREGVQWTKGKRIGELRKTKKQKTKQIPMHHPVCFLCSCG